MNAMRHTLLVLALVVPVLREGTHRAGPGKQSEKMFGHQFYPTPEALIKRMINYQAEYEGQRLWRNHAPKRILEPSAGSGAILSYIYEHAELESNREVQLHCCEIDPELNAMLQGKGFTVVGTDFLEFRTQVPYDLILMNPPFDAAAQHIVHAWSMLNGELVALCNAETVRHPRGAMAVRLQQLLQQGGTVEYVGRPFAQSERPTDVEVALIRLHRKQDSEIPEWWANADFQTQVPPDTELTDEAEPGLVRYDRIDALVSAYASSQEAFRQLVLARERVYRAMAVFSGGSHTDPVEEALKVVDTHDDKGASIAKGERLFTGALQAKAWGSVFAQTKFQDYATAGVHRNLRKLLEQQQATAFDRPNITAMLELLFVNRGEILKQAMLETFDRLCSFYPGNQSHWEGWQSNAAHMVNRKVVVPYCGLSYDRRWGGSFSTHSMHSSMDDIDRTMAMLEGRKLSDATRLEHLRWTKPRYGAPEERRLITIAEAIRLSIAALPTPIENHFFHDLDNTAESEYFLIRYWKKGTVHLYFKDERLWQMFNLEAARGKNWLPNDPNRPPAPPKTTSSERAAVRELEVLAERRRMVALEQHPTT